MTQLAVFALLSSAVLLAAPATIRRMDGTRIPVKEADDFARKTLAAAHVTGAQIAFVDRGKPGVERGLWPASPGSGVAHEPRDHHLGGVDYHQRQNLCLVGQGEIGIGARLQQTLHGSAIVLERGKD